MKKWIGLMVLCVGCTSPTEARKTLDNEGYTDVVTGGVDLFACGQDDGFSTTFTATNSRGKRVSGVVCCGLLKSCTVRF